MNGKRLHYCYWVLCGIEPPHPYTEHYLSDFQCANYLQIGSCINLQMWSSHWYLTRIPLFHFLPAISSFFIFFKQNMLSSFWDIKYRVLDPHNPCFSLTGSQGEEWQDRSCRCLQRWRRSISPCSRARIRNLDLVRLNTLNISQPKWILLLHDEVLKRR